MPGKLDLIYIYFRDESCKEAAMRILGDTPSAGTFSCRLSPLSSLSMILSMILLLQAPSSDSAPSDSAAAGKHRSTNALHDRTGDYLEDAAGH